MKAIIASNELHYIGLNGRLPWKSKEDLQHFKKLTEGKILLCGYNTYQTLPNVVKSRTTVYCDPRGDELHWIVESNSDVLEDVWCIGGRKTYEKYAHLFTELHKSHINDNTIGDCVEPLMEHLNPNCKIFDYYFEADE